MKDKGGYTTPFNQHKKVKDKGGFTSHTMLAFAIVIVVIISFRFGQRFLHKTVTKDVPPRQESQGVEL